MGFGFIGFTGLLHKSWLHFTDHYHTKTSVLSPAGLMTIFYCLRFETLPIWRARSPYLYPLGTWWSGYTLRHWVCFPSPPMTRRATVEVFDTASTRAFIIFTIITINIHEKVHSQWNIQKPKLEHCHQKKQIPTCIYRQARVSLHS
jgi:hypothetical protein